MMRERYVDGADGDAAVGFSSSGPATDYGSSMDERREFERAYCLYMLNREAESLKTLEDGEPLSGRRAQLAAQIHYRLGNFEQAAELFRKVRGLG